MANRTEKRPGIPSRASNTAAPPEGGAVSATEPETKFPPSLLPKRSVDVRRAVTRWLELEEERRAMLLSERAPEAPEAEEEPF